ncbi:hypothetical protein [Streptomyces sp. NBC_01353]|uniref:hypothetical protein n=1 Tax=Streptomyces sp. NBC_01353 TaxID=2903835 RepID=UPI002E2EB0F8|nr:hypothetical protein [Streptomyces sp. NBC_01353]
MTLFDAPILTNGATHSAQAFRMLVRDLSLGAEGITQGDDLKVTQLDTPGGGVQISDGSGIVRGRVSAFQGSYAVCNVGEDTIDIAATGGTPRSDLVIIRVEDPEYEGTLDPEVDPVVYFDVISNVSSSATAIPDGRTGIPLARIDIPASTATITDAMIVDVRQIANPRRQRQMLPVQSPTSASNDLGASTTFAYWTTVPGWSVAIPDWASKAIVDVRVSSLRLTTNNFYGAFRATFGASLTLQSVTIDDNQGTGVRRVPTEAADTLTIPSAYRGTSQVLRPQAAGYSGNLGRASANESTTFLADIEFIEAPR